MKRFFILPLVVLALTACVKENLDSTTTQESPSSKIYYASESATQGRLFVKLDAPIDNFSVEGLDISVEPLFRGKWDETLSRWVVVRFDEGISNAEVAEALAKDSRVVRIEYEVMIKPIRGERLEVPASRPEPTRSQEMPFNDPELEWQWHYYNDGWLSDSANDPSQCLAGADINLFNAWKYTAGDNRVIVAVCDGGIMTDHNDLKDNIWVNEAEANGTRGVDDDGNGYIDDVHGYNFVRDCGDVTADSHGTHVAGTISAVNNNGFSGCGIAGGTGNGDGVKLMSVQIFEGENNSTVNQIAEAIKYAADNGAVIINNSWCDNTYANESDNGFEESGFSMIYDALKYFREKAKLEGVMDGGLVVFAAGNDAHPAAAYPAAHRDFICVSSMSPDYKAAYYTNYGPGVTICAPGGDSIYGTVFCISSSSVENANADGYEYMQGTSMACPHVSGCAALAVSYALKQGYRLTPKSLTNLIHTSVHDINKYQVGTKTKAEKHNGQYVYVDMSLEPYVGNLGSGYIDAHLLLMQMDNTPCLYFETGVESLLSLDEYFGGGSSSLNFEECDASSDVRTALGIEVLKIENGMLKIKATKPGSGRVSVKAIVGGDQVGGDQIGGSYVEREFEIVVRGAVAANGGWL